MSLSVQQVKEFKSKGFIVLKSFFDSPSINRFSSIINELRDKTPDENQEAKYYETSPTTGQDVLVRIEHVLGDYNSELTDLLITPKVNVCLTQLLGEPAFLFKEKINYKLPGCRPDKLHQDQAAGWNTYGDFFISMAIVVDANRKDNGALSFMNSGNYKRALMTDEWKPMTENDPPYEPEDEYVLLEADPGDVVFFDAYVPHGSPANTSDRSRRNIFLTFNRQSDGDMRDRYYGDKWKSYAPNNAEAARTDASFRV